MNITEEQLEKLKNLNDSRVNEILKLGLKVGKWYKKKSYGDLMFYFNGKYTNKNNENNYGFDYDGVFQKEIGVHKHEVNEYYGATKQEVEQALIAEAKRRGFKQGVKVSRSWTNRKIVNIQDNNFRLDDINTLLLYGYEIFKDGVWAEIIDDKSELKEEIKELRKKLKSLEEKL